MTLMLAMLQKLFLVLQDRSSALKRRYVLILGLFLLILCYLVLHTGIVPQADFGHDTGVLLDGAWRIVQGQRPHVDFITPLGPVTFLVLALGMEIAGLSANALAGGVAVILVLSVWWAWCIASNRLSPTLSFLLALYVGATTVGTHIMGFDYTVTTYACIYNRIGYAFLSIVLIEVLAPPAANGAERRGELWGGLSTGILTSLLLFLKVNFFAVAAAAAIISCLAQTGRKPRRWGLAAGFFLTPFIFLAYINFDVASMVRDVTLGVKLRKWALSSDVMGHVISRDLPAFALLVPAGALLLLKQHRSVDRIKSGTPWKILLAVLCVVAADEFLQGTNTVGENLVIFPVPVLILLEHVIRSGKPEGLREWGLFGSSVVALVIVLGMSYLTDLGGFAYSAIGHSRSAELQKTAFRSDRLSSMIIVSSRPTCDRYSYAEKINDGMDLITENAPKNSRIAVLDFSNLFSFALGHPSPRGDMLWWHYGVSFNEYEFPDAETVFRNVDVIMLPKCEEDRSTVAAALDLYREYFKRNYAIGAESRVWYLLLREGADGAGQR